MASAYHILLSLIEMCSENLLGIIRFLYIRYFSLLQVPISYIKHKIQLDLRH